MNLPPMAAAQRLAQCRPYRTDDLDAARDHISRLFKPHDLAVVGRGQKLDVCIGGGGIDEMSLIYHRHGARVSVKPGTLDKFFLLQIPIRGQARARVGGQDILCSPGRGVMISPKLEADMEFMQGCEQLILRVDASSLERFVGRQSSRTPNRPLEFAPSVDLTGKAGLRVLALLEYLATVIHEHNDGEYPEIVRQGISSLALGTLVSSLDHNYREILQKDVEAQKPHHVKRALRFMEESVRSSITPEDIAHAINVSPRTLFGSFKQYLNTTPMRHLKNLRLDRAREHLLKADPQADSVTAVAIEYRFEHFGHFSAAYKERHGELPSDTLGRRSDLGQSHGKVHVPNSTQNGSRH